MARAQPLVLLSGFEALQRIERAICPDAATRDPAVAEGLALVGLRAASLSNGLAERATGALVAPGASCVHHSQGLPGHGGRCAFELAATSVQQAVDHCLVAHCLSQRLGRAGLCSLAPALAGALDLVRLPGPALLAGVLGSSAGVPEPDAEPERILELAREAFRLVGERTTRGGDVVEYDGDAEAQVVLVGCAGEAALAREVARALREAGVAAAALSLNLVRPFPAREVRQALSATRDVFVIEAAGRRDALLTAVRAAAKRGGRIRALRSGAPVRLLEALAERIPDSGLDPQRHAKLPEPLRGRLVVAPAGPWGDETARQAAMAFGQLGPLRVARRTRRHLGAVALAWGGEAIPPGAPDLLLVAHPALLEPRGALALIPSGGTVVVLASARSEDELLQRIGSGARRALWERNLRVHWVAPPDLLEAEPAGESEHASSLTLAGAALAALHGAGDASGEDAAKVVAGRLEAEGRPLLAGWLRGGAERVRPLERALLDPSRQVEEVDFRTTPTLPRMAEPVEATAPPEGWAERIRRFHRTGTGAALGPAAELPVRPAVLSCVAKPLRRSSQHPFVAFPREDPERPIAARGLRDLLAEAALALQGAGHTARVLVENLERLAILAAHVLAQRPPGTKLASLLREAGEKLVEDLELPEAAEAALVEDLEELLQRLPEDGTVLELRADTPTLLYLQVLEAERAPLRARFSDELDELRERLEELLQLDRMSSAEGSTAAALAATLGGSASRHLDPETLSRTLPRAAGSAGLDPERRQRIREALATIEHHLEQRDALPTAVLLRPPGMHLGVPQAQELEHPDPLRAAVGVFDGLARRLGKLFRAVRIARLEATGRYRSELHDTLLVEPDWQALSAEELRLTPAVAVVTTGRRLRQHELGSLSELLRSSRPVHVIVQDEVGAADEAEDASRFHADLGYLVVAHREAFAVASTLARPDYLVESLLRAARALRPAVALVSLPALEPVQRRSLLAEAALQGRVRPEFRYDPDAGPSWADRFDLSSNPQPERPWPLHRLEYLEEGAEQSLEVACTFADAVALEPAYSSHLRIIPRAAWNDDQLPLAEYLERFDPEGRDRSIPYLWVLDEQASLQRAVVTRHLAVACRDRLRAWRVLQELAGYQNVFAERAAAAARGLALAEAELGLRELDQAHTEELDQVRRQGSQESMERLAEALLSPDVMAGIAAPATPAVRPPEPPLAVPALEEVAPAEERAEEPAAVAQDLEDDPILSFDEPYIDSPLCTTCNECPELNPALFQYDSEKQAFIADASAGTFAELVKAAELCPARCIHPGKPRSDDATASPELIERAAAFQG
ncbi:MAG: ferredoxin [Myxococcota bacterium]